jgi:hypothetical protein
MIQAPALTADPASALSVVEWCLNFTNPTWGQYEEALDACKSIGADALHALIEERAVAHWNMERPKTTVKVIRREIQRLRVEAARKAGRG